MIIGCESAHALAASAPFEPEPRLQRPEVSSKLEVSSGYAQAGMAELADAADSKSAGLRPLGVRLPLPAPALRLLNPISCEQRRGSHHSHPFAHSSPKYSPTGAPSGRFLGPASSIFSPLHKAP